MYLVYVESTYKASKRYSNKIVLNLECGNERRSIFSLITSWSLQKELRVLTH